MIPTLHPDEALLAAHAAGTLPRGARIVLATHLETCPACRRAARTAEAVGGALLADLPAAPLAPDALARTLARLGPQDGPAQSAPPPHPDLAAGLPCPRALDALPVGPWRWVGPGMRRISLFSRRDNEGFLYLLRIAPGLAMPDHTHTGMELTAVLAGAFTDRFGRVGPGDLALTTEEDEHQPVADPGTECICLAFTETPLRFNSPIARLLQPLLGV